jgi:quercetin dioxygenase-like cupin family protein
MNKRFLALVCTCLLVLLVSACGTSTQSAPASTPTSNPATAQGYSDQILATGKVAGLPAGPLYINVIDVPQAAGNKLTHKHVAGFVYVVAGTQTLAMVGGGTMTLQPGQAGFTGAGILHSHINPGSTANDWYFLSVRPTTARTLPPFAPGVKTLYATADLPALPAGAYDEALHLVTLQPGGRDPAHTDSGVEVLFVLEGSISVHMAGQAPVTFTSGQWFYALPTTAVQELNAGSGVARYLAFYVGPAGQTFQTTVDHAP